MHILAAMCVRLCYYLVNICMCINVHTHCYKTKCECSVCTYKSIYIHTYCRYADGTYYKGNWEHGNRNGLVGPRQACIYVYIYIYA